MQNLQIYFDGGLMELDDFNGTQSASFVFRKKSDSGESAYSFAPDLVLTGAAYDYVYNQIISAANPILSEILVEIYDTCCIVDGAPRLIFTGRIEGSDVRWCTVPVCEATITIIDNSRDSEAIRCLKNIFPWDEKYPYGTTSATSLPTKGIDEFRYAPFMYYCNDLKPSATQEAIMIMGIALFMIISPILLLIQLFNIISNIDENVFENLSNFIVGCGRRHIAPFVDSQLKNMCKICGLQYQSTLFDVGGYYHNTVKMDIAYVPGVGNNQQGTGDQRARLGNRANLNGIQFLEFFKQCNIDWRVVDNTLTVERKDYFVGPLWFDLTTLPDEKILSVCFDATDIKPAAYAEYMYPKDGVDNSGDEVAKGWTQRAIDWNVPINANQSGLFSKTFTFSAAQFRFDGNANDVNPIDKPAYVTWYPFVQTPENEVAMFLEKGISGFPKLINLQSISGQVITSSVFERGQAIPDFKLFPSGLRAYNYKWWVFQQPFTDAGGNTYDTAYQTLFNIDDPRNTTVKTRRITITVTADCDLLTGLSVDKFIHTTYGDVQIDEITYDTNNNSLTINGRV